MVSDLLAGLAWVAIVMLPVLVACRLPIESGDEYFNRYFDSSDPDAGTSESAAPSGTKA